jgi:hypothetical protein
MTITSSAKFKAYIPSSLKFGVQNKIQEKEIHG